MKPVYQTEFGQGVGNCYAACLASILEIPVADVPNFCSIGGYNWVEEANRWLWPRGFGLAIAVGADETFGRLLAESGGYFIAAGPTKREEGLHAVVYHKGNCVHDPMPGGDGLEKVVDFSLLFALNPAGVK